MSRDSSAGKRKTAEEAPQGGGATRTPIYLRVRDDEDARLVGLAARENLRRRRGSLVAAGAEVSKSAIALVALRLGLGFLEAAERVLEEDPAPPRADGDAPVHVRQGEIVYVEGGVATRLGRTASVRIAREVLEALVRRQDGRSA